ncbi:unnamed protein product [Pleuronectes platessa]|uniref:Uncharacterized protein n=1 Tax=Pleuronectes platessa TaxID=8262 RepID=A0A9N7TVE4_PLEPL|nr:unnamed protein product [Pleuronectes platessa]
MDASWAIGAAGSTTGPRSMVLQRREEGEEKADDTKNNNNSTSPQPCRAGPESEAVREGREAGIEEVGGAGAVPVRLLACAPESRGAALSAEAQKSDIQTKPCSRCEGRTRSAFRGFFQTQREKDRGKKKDGRMDGESWRAEADSGDSAFPLEAD